MDGLVNSGNKYRLQFNCVTEPIDSMTTHMQLKDIGLERHPNSRWNDEMCPIFFFFFWKLYFRSHWCHLVWWFLILIFFILIDWAEVINTWFSFFQPFEMWNGNFGFVRQCHPDCQENQNLSFIPRFFVWFFLFEAHLKLLFDRNKSTVDLFKPKETLCMAKRTGQTDYDRGLQRRSFTTQHSSLHIINSNNNKAIEQQKLIKYPIILTTVISFWSYECHHACTQLFVDIII